eukprot:3028558-Rhodomonas_salina.2
MRDRVRELSVIRIMWASQSPGLCGNASATRVAPTSPRDSSSPQSCSSCSRLNGSSAQIASAVHSGSQAFPAMNAARQPFTPCACVPSPCRSSVSSLSPGTPRTAIASLRRSACSSEHLGNQSLVCGAFRRTLAQLSTVPCPTHFQSPA